jgi:hypothetical protein
MIEEAHLEQSVRFRHSDLLFPRVSPAASRDAQGQAGISVFEFLDALSLMNQKRNNHRSHE